MSSHQPIGFEWDLMSSPSHKDTENLAVFSKICFSSKSFTHLSFQNYIILHFLQTIAGKRQVHVRLVNENMLGRRLRQVDDEESHYQSPWVYSVCEVGDWGAWREGASGWTCFAYLVESFWQDRDSRWNIAFEIKAARMMKSFRTRVARSVTSSTFASTFACLLLLTHLRSSVESYFPS